MRIGMIGFGTVGQGVAQLLQRHASDYHDRVGQPLQLAAILVRDASRKRETPTGDALLTDDPDAFFDARFDLLVEVAGGVHPAREYVQRALLSGRDVVTANKALIAAETDEIFSLAFAEGLHVGIEATVAGGVPVIELLRVCLAANRVERIAGIFNGTCNFIIETLAADPSASFDDAVAEAQRLGYAEADPTLDISGRDSVEKLAIVSAVCLGAPVDVDSIHCTGITGIEPIDVAAGRELGLSLKLLGVAQRTDEGLCLFNEPVFVRLDHRLARTGPNEMGVAIEADALPLMFVGGTGAGRLPTASAVVADVIAIARRRVAKHALPYHEELPAGGDSALPQTYPRRRYYLRAAPDAAADLEKHLASRDIAIDHTHNHDRHVCVTTSVAPHSAIATAPGVIASYPLLD